MFHKSMEMSIKIIIRTISETSVYLRATFAALSQNALTTFTSLGQNVSKSVGVNRYHFGQ